jgi:hypothetical protein
VTSGFSESHYGGEGPPLLLLHGFTCRVGHMPQLDVPLESAGLIAGAAVR